MSYTQVITDDSYFDDFKKSVQEVSDSISALQSNESIFINKDSGIFYLDGISESLQCIAYQRKLSKLIVDLLINQAMKTFTSSPFFSDFPFSIL